MDNVSIDLVQARARPTLCAMAILALAVLTITGAFAFQLAGYPPCELCLKQRLPYYAGIGIASVLFLLLLRKPTGVVRAGFVLLTILFLFSAGLGGYHAGVEWGLWPGPSDCTGTLDHAATNADFLHQLQNVKVVRCDAVAIRIFGLSLAGWNTLISLALALLALRGATSKMLPELA